MADRYQNNRSGKRTNANAAPEQAFVEGFLKTIVDLVTFLFGKKKGASTGTAAELKKLGESWEQVELYVLQSATFVVAVSEADKIVDAALKLKRFHGQTMGERLKAAQSFFPPDLYNQLWSAHKLRNTLAHEVGASTHAAEVRIAIGSFRAALYQLGVLR